LEARHYTESAPVTQCKEWRSTVRRLTEMILGEQGTEAHSRSLNYLRLKEELPFSPLVALHE